MATSSKKRRVRSGVRLPVWVIALLVLAGLVLLVGSSIWLFQIVRNTASTLDIINPDFGSVTEPTRGVPVLVGETSGQVTNDPPPLISAEAVDPWSGNNRVSILLLGIDQRCDEGGPTHTDSMMVLTIDPIGLSAAVLSLPRDMWVEIPGFGVDRINQAHYLGQVYEYPGGGPMLATETVETTLGVAIDYYVAVSFDAFVEAVDLIGGVMIDIPEAIDDPSYPDKCYGYDPFSIDGGMQRLDGDAALKYARTRATFGGDVDRAGRQQAVLMAMRDGILQLNKLPQLITNSLQLWQTFQENVRTNLSFEQALQLALLVQDIPAGSIQTTVVGYEYVYNETTPDGKQVLVPNREKIRELREALFKPPAIPTPVIENLPALMAAEKAQVAIYNGTTVFGLAAATRDYLQGFGVTISEVGNADAVMSVPPLNTSSGRSPEGEFDVLIIIGSDWSVPGS
jgi:LCP family protein required for cell wall assembly